jgi:hypothetical protein
LDQKFVRLNSVLDPHGFNMDPDLALCLWIQILFQIQILIQIQIQVAKPVQIQVDPGRDKIQDSFPVTSLYMIKIYYVSIVYF